MENLVTKGDHKALFFAVLTLPTTNECICRAIQAENAIRGDQTPKAAVFEKAVSYFAEMICSPYFYAVGLSE